MTITSRFCRNQPESPEIGVQNFRLEYRANISRIVPENSAHILTLMKDFRLTGAQGTWLSPSFAQRAADHHWIILGPRQCIRVPTRLFGVSARITWHLPDQSPMRKCPYEPLYWKCKLNLQITGATWGPLSTLFSILNRQTELTCWTEQFTVRFFLFFVFFLCASVFFFIIFY